jgi:hypothetical protein
MDQAADKPEELPRLIMDISGSRYAYTTAGFQIVPMVPYKLEKGKGEYDPIDRYREIYGNSIQACKELGSDGKCLEWTGDLKKAKFGPCTRTEAGPGGEGSCVERPLKLVRFIDSAGGGQIINYEAAVRQCRQIVDRYVCKQECERGKPKGSEENCGKICREKIETPWYCQTQEEHPTVDHRYTFFRLNKLFGISQPSQENKQKKEMGLQPDYTQLTNVEKNTLHKQETNAGVATDEQKDWQVTTQRTLRHLDRSTADSGAAGVATEPVDTVYREKAGQSQATAWKGAP